MFQDSCLPVGVFVWNIENYNPEPRDVSITFTFKNGTGGSADKEGKSRDVERGGNATLNLFPGIFDNFTRLVPLIYFLVE